MNAFEAERRFAERMKRFYPAGTRIELDQMNDPYAPVPVSTRGTVKAVDDMGQLLMDWDNGRTLSLIPGVDSFHRLSEEEPAEEQEQTESQDCGMTMK